MKIIHLSDLHFGTETPQNTRLLLETIDAHKPDLVVISGDFTQHASSAEFERAQSFIGNLSARVFSVPGNHDIPGFNLFKRFADPFHRYSEYITHVLNPIYEDPEVVICGLNTARPILPHWNWANGAVSKWQRDRIKEIFSPDEARWTVCVMHHPIHKVAYTPINVTVFGHNATLNTIKNARVDLILTGHVHHASITTIGDQSHQSVYLSASTALSSRVRGEQSNGFNVITLTPDIMSITCYVLENGRFTDAQSYEHKRL